MNEYKIVGDYVVGYTGRHHNEFYFDLEDFDIVKNYNWSLTSKHDVIDKNHNGKRVSMKKLIMGEGVWCNKNGLKNDNRKANLAPARGFHNNGKVKLNGQVLVYMPEHSRAFSNGCVYEHIVVAEQQILYRALGSEECVHHINHNRSDNRPENLMVFATSNDHSAYHQGRTAQQMSDGSYICKDKYIHKKCPICGGNKDFAAKMCVKCYRKQQLTHKSNKEISENEINT